MELINESRGEQGNYGAEILLLFFIAVRVVVVVAATGDGSDRINHMIIIIIGIRSTCSSRRGKRSKSNRQLLCVCSSFSCVGGDHEEGPFPFSLAKRRRDDVDVVLAFACPSLLLLLLLSSLLFEHYSLVFKVNIFLL